MPDVPETTWFATDGAGHVAVFESGSRGAVPQNVLDRGAPYEDLADLLDDFADRCSAFVSPLPSLDALGDASAEVLERRVRAVTDWIAHPESTGRIEVLDRDGRLRANETRDLASRFVPTSIDDAFLDSCVIEVASTDVLHRLEVTGPTVLFRGPRLAAFVRSCKLGPTWQALRDGQVAGIRFVDEPDELPAFLGWFHFRHEDDAFGLARPYERLHAPREPVLVDSLPDRIRDCVRTTQLTSVAFASSAALQPAAITACQSNATSYRDAFGRAHSFAD